MRKNLLTEENLRENIAKQVELLNTLMTYLKYKPKTFHEIVLQKYVEVQSVVKVAAYINDLGYKIETDNGFRKYISNDISQIIRAKDIDADKGLHDFAKQIHLHMKKKVGSLYN